MKKFFKICVTYTLKQGGRGLFLSVLLISHNNKELFDGKWILGNGGDQTVSLVDHLRHHGESNSPYITCLIVQADPHISRATSHLRGISPRLHGGGWSRDPCPLIRYGGEIKARTICKAPRSLEPRGENYKMAKCRQIQLSLLY